MKKENKKYSSTQLVILIDYRQQFYSSTLGRGTSLDISTITSGFEALGYTVHVCTYAEVDFSKQNYENTLVLYKSSEDPALRYKDYIEDILLGMAYQGATLIPGFKYFRAHHNKVFMEIIRSSLMGKFGLPFARYYGTYEEYAQYFVGDSFPVVFKSAAGSKSSNVFIAHNKREADLIAKKISSTPSSFNKSLQRLSQKEGGSFLPISNNRNKFIVQDFIAGIPGDYKVLVYGDRYFTFYRENRIDDFRASGTLDFVFVDSLPDAVLDFAKEIYDFFNVPFISLDIGYDQKQCYLFEFQFVEFGQRAVQRSSHYFQKNEKKWERVIQKSKA